MSGDNLLKEMANAADVQNEHLENIAISLSEIADCLSQFLDFINVVNFDELQAREEALRATNEKRL